MIDQPTLGEEEADATKALAGSDTATGPSPNKRPRINSLTSNKSTKSNKQESKASPPAAPKATSPPEASHPRRNLRLVINESKHEQERKLKKDEEPKKHDNSKKDSILKQMNKLNSNMKQKALKESF